MFKSSESLYLSVTTQLLVTACLVTLLWALYTRLQRFDFFRWWAWAWTAFSIYLATATLSLWLRPSWTAEKVCLIGVLLLSGYLQPVLLVFGGISWQRPKKVSGKTVCWGLGITLAAALTCFGLAFSFRGIPILSFAVRNAPRTLFLACALQFCCMVFGREYRRSGSYAAVITAAFCFTYSLDQVLYFLSFSEMALLHWNLYYPPLLHSIANVEYIRHSGLLFVDLVDTCGICLGMILLLVERYQRTAAELELSEKQRLGLAVDNASMQFEIEHRLRVEEELRRSEEFNRQVVRNSPVAMMVARGSLHCIEFANEKFLSLFGYSEDEVRQVSDWWARAYPDVEYRKSVQEQWQRLVNSANQGSAENLAMEARVCCKDGSFRDIECHLSLVNDVYTVSFVDLTERKKAMEDLRESESRYRDLVEHSEDLIGTHRLDGRIVTINETPCRRLGYTLEEVLKMKIQDLLAAQYKALYERFVHRVVAHGQATGLMVVVTRNGEERVWEYHSTLRREGVSEPLIRGMAHDVTERFRAEQALRQSEAKFRLVADTVNSAIWLLQDMRFVYFNKEFERITGYSREEILSMDPWDLVDPDFRTENFARAEARLSGEPVPSRYQFAILTKNGEKRWLDFSAALTEFNGKPAILASALDITPARRAEQEMKEHAMYMEALISNIPLGVVIKDENQLVRFCNPAFEHMFLYSQGEIQGKNLDDVIAPHDRYEAAQLSRTVQTGGVVHKVVRRRRKDGTFLDVEVHGIRVFSGKSFVGAFAIYQDITDRRRSEEKLIMMRNRLARAQEEERARIARDLHDDAGQRLALLSIDLEQLKQASMQIKSSLTEQLESLVKAASEITSDVHNVSRRLHPSQVELLGLAAALSNFCKDFGARNGMEIEFIEGVLHQRPAQDAALCLFRVAQEAIRNVQKHSGTQRALVQLDEVSGSIYLRVSDEGEGFDPDSPDFAQGLGLLSMQERLNSLRGDLFIHSRRGGGTCIEACIPLKASVRSGP
jgi:PAS domain S-box-containing protein